MPQLYATRKINPFESTFSVSQSINATTMQLTTLHYSTFDHFANVGLVSPFFSTFTCYRSTQTFTTFPFLYRSWSWHDQEIVSVNQNYQLISLFASDGFLNFVKLQFRRDRITTPDHHHHHRRRANAFMVQMIVTKSSSNSVMATINGTATVPFVCLCAKVICTRHTKHQLNRCTMTLRCREFLWRKRKSFQFSRWSFAI